MKNPKKVFSDREVRRIGKKEFVVSMSDNEQENFIDEITNKHQEFFYCPKTNRYTIQIEWHGSSLGVPAFETWAQARTFGLGQNKVIERTCHLDGGGKKEFYIPVPTNTGRRIN